LIAIHDPQHTPVANAAIDDAISRHAADATTLSKRAPEAATKIERGRRGDTHRGHAIGESSTIAEAVVHAAERGPDPVPSFDPHAALAEVRIGALSFVLAASSRPIRSLAQRLLSGPAELDAPRPLTVAEHAIWALVIAAAIEDTGIAAEVWPLGTAAPRDGITIELLVSVGGAPMTVTAVCPREIPLRLPPARELPGWTFDVPIRIGACVLPRETMTRLEVRDVITMEAQLALAIGDGTIGLRAAPGALEAEVTTGYVPREMPLADDAHLELTVQLGTTRLSLRQLSNLVPGQIVSLGRPLAGPFEVRAAGRLVGTGELVDVDGELGVRIVSLQEQ
jgi:flagellar motor switch/type III secretory pathway protein FliN